MTDWIPRTFLNPDYPLDIIANQALMRHAVSWTSNFCGSTSLESPQLPEIPWAKDSRYPPG